MEAREQVGIEKTMRKPQYPSEAQSEPEIRLNSLSLLYRELVFVFFTFATTILDERLGFADIADASPENLTCCRRPAAAKISDLNPL